MAMKARMLGANENACPETVPQVCSALDLCGKLKVSLNAPLEPFIEAIKLRPKAILTYKRNHAHISTSVEKNRKVGQRATGKFHAAEA